MLFGLKRFFALVLFIGLFFENSAQSLPRPRLDSPVHHSHGFDVDNELESTVSEKPFDWSNAAKVAEFSTVALSIPAQAAYRTALLKYEDGKRIKKPFFVKSLVSGLRVLNGMLTLYNQGSVSNNLMRQRYTAFWVIMDTVQLFSNALPQDSIDTIKRYIPERLTRKLDELLSQDTQVADESLFAKINEFLNDDQYVQYLRNYVLPTLEESLLVWTALDTDSSEVAQKRKLYVAGVKGICRCLEEILDTKDIMARKFYIGVLVSHIISMGFDVFAPDCIKGQEKRKEEEIAAAKKKKEEEEKLERDKKKKNGDEKDEKKKDDNKRPKRFKDYEEKTDDKSDDSSKKDDQDGPNKPSNDDKPLAVNQPEQEEQKEKEETDKSPVLPTEEEANVIHTSDIVEQPVVEQENDDYSLPGGGDEDAFEDPVGSTVPSTFQSPQSSSVLVPETDERFVVGLGLQEQVNQEQVNIEGDLFGITRSNEENEPLDDGGDVFPEENGDSVVSGALIQAQAPVQALGIPVVQQQVQPIVPVVQQQAQVPAPVVQPQAPVLVRGNDDFEMNYRWPAKKIRKEFNNEVDRLKVLAVNDSVSLDELDQIQAALRTVDLMAIRRAGPEKNWATVRENELAPYEYHLREISDKLENN